MKKHLYIVCIIFMMILSDQYATAQYYYAGDKLVNSFSPVLGDIEGSPFLTEKWFSGNVTNCTGVTSKNVRLKYDVLDDRILFVGTNDELLMFPEKINSFTINHNIFSCGFPPVDTLTINTYYQVEAAGKVTLLKHLTKSIQKIYVYNSAVPKYRFADIETWYILKDGKMLRISPNEKSLINAVNDHKTELMDFSKNNKNDRSELQLAMLVTYYNNIQ